ncbi:hypothetical protein LSG31_08960 [Fodinisporobacter ferrooxydans]|uniref:Uncharacterized protein n=1 Tax=Fodinisporobacter ferrooxydans TaxID=2901836 RepID=A0ABY4CKK7_9BACL|nr:hypothetical protein LSG31_01840 [Alicyclobacillaceae bacterium MYW30-H2]UOF92270.1 hypothetical protein LSG31_08960 [Alicyclobacillaceae bacterium MYW30-H2]
MLNNLVASLYDAHDNGISENDPDYDKFMNRVAKRRPRLVQADEDTAYHPFVA